MNRPIDSCNAIIIWEDKILLFQRDNKPNIPNPDTWSLPGGGRDDGETPDEAIKRELTEEVSHIPKNLKFLFKRRKDDGKMNYIYAAFINKSEAVKYILGEFEGQDVAFFTLEETLKLKLPPLFRKYLLEYRNILNTVIKEGSFDKLLKN